MAAERLTFLFWNIQRKPLAGLLEAIVGHHGVDILLLAETGDGLPSRLGDLVPRVGRCPRVAVYAREAARPIRESERWTIRALETGDGELLLAAAHLPSRLRFSAESQDMEVLRFAREIRDLEQERGHTADLW